MTLLHDVGAALYGPRWQSPLARDLGMSDRHIRRLAAGTAELGDGIRDDLLQLCLERASVLANVIGRLRTEAATTSP